MGQPGPARAAVPAEWQPGPIRRPRVGRSDSGYRSLVPPPRHLPPWARRWIASGLNAAYDWVSELGAVGPDHPRARRFAAFGAGSLLGYPPGSIYNESCIAIGCDSIIGPRVTLTAGMAPGQQMVTQPVVSIGDRTIIGRGSHIVGHLSIDIGDDIQTGPYVYITDQNHVYEQPDVPIGQQWPREAAVSIGAGSWLGAAVIVLPGARIGHHVTVGAGSVVTGALPDRCVAVGAPARVIRRYDAERGWVPA